jgi:hypothetical protein
VSRLRAKLAAAGAEGVIENIRGLGYVVRERRDAQGTSRDRRRPLRPAGRLWLRRAGVPDVRAPDGPFARDRPALRPRTRDGPAGEPQAGGLVRRSHHARRDPAVRRTGRTRRHVVGRRRPPPRPDGVVTHERADRTYLVTAAPWRRPPAASASHTTSPRRWRRGARWPVRSSRAAPSSCSPPCSARSSAFDACSLRSLDLARPDARDQSGHDRQRLVRRSRRRGRRPRRRPQPDPRGDPSPARTGARVPARGRPRAGGAADAGALPPRRPSPRHPDEARCARRPRPRASSCAPRKTSWSSLAANWSGHWSTGSSTSATWSGASPTSTRA